uniref:Uncharacterized protein n=1 Tax=Meloidogyne hapla TaxID=6305 RepID=A0A1I8AX73_MELHA
MNEGYSRYWNRFPPSMNPYGQYGSFYGNRGMQGLNNPFYGRNTQPGYYPYNNYYPLYGGNQQNRFASSLSYPYRTFGGPYN